MKSIALVVSLILAMNLFSQSQTEAELVNTFLKAEKKALVAQNMNLTDQNAETFWDLYDEYTLERQELVKDRTKVLDMYMGEFNNITDEQVDEIMNSTLTSRKSSTKLMTKYYKKMKKDINPSVATRFYMVEEQIQLIIKVAMWESLPMVDTHVDKISQSN